MEEEGFPKLWSQKEDRVDVTLGLKWVQVVYRFESWKDKRSFHLKFVAFFL